MCVGSSGNRPKRAESPVRVHAPGGIQTVRWEDQVFLRGSGATHLPGRISGLGFRNVLTVSNEIQMASDRTVTRIKPPALQAGDTVGIVAPASNVNATFGSRLRTSSTPGIQTVLFDSILDQDIYFAGSAERRAQELEEMFVA